MAMLGTIVKVKSASRNVKNRNRGRAVSRAETGLQNAFGIAAAFAIGRGTFPFLYFLD